MRHHFASCAAGLLFACTLPGDASDRLAPPEESPPSVAATVVDSILAPAEEMRRFRAGGGPPRDSLTGGAKSRRALVHTFLRALETNDTVTIRSLVLDRVEFADLYFPVSRYTQAPYRTPVGLLWTQIQLTSEKGITRALRRLGGRPLRLVDVTCPSPPEMLGQSRLFNRCLTRFRTLDGDTATRRLFGAIMETNGRVKFVSYANDM